MSTTTKILLGLILGVCTGLYQHWIVGRGSTATGPRWSVIRDVLHWID